MRGRTGKVCANIKMQKKWKEERRRGVCLISFCCQNPLVQPAFTPDHAGVVLQPQHKAGQYVVSVLRFNKIIILIHLHLLEGTEGRKLLWQMDR